MIRLFHTDIAKDVTRSHDRHQLAASNHSAPFFQPFRRPLEYLRLRTSGTHLCFRCPFDGVRMQATSSGSLSDALCSHQAYLLVLPSDGLDRLFKRSITSTYIRAHFHHNSGQQLEITHSQCAQSPPTNISAPKGAESGHAFSHRVVAIQDANSVHVSSRAPRSGRFVQSRRALAVSVHTSSQVYVCA